MKILIKNHQRRRPLNKQKIKKTARNILSVIEQPMAELSIMFVGDKKMSQLNSEYRGINRSTDVLAFPQDLMNEPSMKKDQGIVPLIPSKASRRLLLGDVVISIPRAEYQAKLYGLKFYDELLRLLIHGTLHLAGYDHEKSIYKAKKMRKKELETLNAVKKMDPKY